MFASELATRLRRTATYLLPLQAALLLVMVAPGLAAGHEAAVSEQEMMLLKSRQKESYYRGHWDEFFGAAQAYRRYWFSKAPEPELVVLEALALIKFCHYEEAYRLSTGLRSRFGSQSPQLLEKLNKLEAMIPGLKALKITLAKSRDGATSRAGARFKEVKWPAPKELPTGMSPSGFRAKVVSRCDH